AGGGRYRGRNGEPAPLAAAMCTSPSPLWKRVASLSEAKCEPGEGSFSRGTATLTGFLADSSPPSERTGGALIEWRAMRLIPLVHLSPRQRRGFLDGLLSREGVVVQPAGETVVPIKTEP